MHNNRQKCLGQLKSKNEIDRKCALEELLAFNDSDIIDILISSLSDHSIVVRGIAIDALIKAKSNKCFSPLIEILGTENVLLRSASIEILNKIASVNLEVFMNTLRESEDDDLTMFILDILILNSNKITFSENDLGIVTNILSSSDQNLVGAVSELLALTNPKEIIGYLKEKDVIQNGWVQYNILNILKERDNESFVLAMDLISNNYKTQESALFMRRNKCR